MNRPRYSVVIPVYNTTTALVDLCNSLKNIFNDLGILNFEIILINDSSPNKETWDTLDRLGRSEDIYVIHLTKNFGQQAATYCGLVEAKGDFVITMDDDMQHHPSQLPSLLAYTSEFDIVVGHFKEKKHTFFKRFTSRIKERFDRIILGKPKGIQLSAYRVLSRPVVDGIISIKTPSPFISSMMFYVSKSIKGVEIEHFSREEGVSGYTFRSLLKLFSFLLINNSSLLLKLVGRIGLFVLGISFIVSIFIFVNALYGRYNVAGWTSVILAVFFFGGLQLFAIGIIGEYLIRIINYTELKPAYCILKTNKNTHD